MALPFDLTLNNTQFLHKKQEKNGGLSYIIICLCLG
jgi:hypothetical protein